MGSGATAGYASRSQVWTLDALGNWGSVTTNTTTEDRTHNGQNQIDEIESVTQTYDDNGNYTALGDNTVYDAWNQLVKASNGSGGSEAGTTFAYDALGRRVEMVNFDNAVTVGGTDQHDYYYDDRGRMLQEFVPTDANSLRYLYLWSPFYVNEMVLRSHWSEAGGGGSSESNSPNPGGGSEGGEDDLGGGDEAPIDWFLDGAGASGSEELSSVSTETETASTIELLYVQQDANYNVTSLTSTSGTVVARYVYDVYGAADAVNTSTWASLGGLANDPYGFQYLFQGMRWESGVGLYHSDTRDYSPTLGRWTGQDYLGGFVDGGNLYEMEASEPVARLDATGEFSGKIKVGPGDAQVIAIRSGEAKIGINITGGEVQVVVENVDGEVIDLIPTDTSVSIETKEGKYPETEQTKDLPKTAQEAQDRVRAEQEKESAKKEQEAKNKGDKPRGPSPSRGQGTQRPSTATPTTKPASGPSDVKERLDRKRSVGRIVIIGVSSAEGTFETP